jgi:hypothetical protein
MVILNTDKWVAFLGTMKFQLRDMTMEMKSTVLRSDAKQSGSGVLYFGGNRVLQNVDTYLPNIPDESRCSH